DAARGDQRQPDAAGEAAREDPLRPHRRRSLRLAAGGARVARAGRAHAGGHAVAGGARVRAHPGAAAQPQRADRGRPLAGPRGGPDRARAELAALRKGEPVTPLRIALLAALLASGCARTPTAYFTLASLAPPAGAPLAAR